MPRFKVTLEYVGTRDRGWQIQKNARTVAGELHRAVKAVAGREPGELYGSGRTDAGVHALHQVAHLDLETRMPPAQLLWRINEELPADINVLALEPAAHRFHARHAAVARSYLYQIARRRWASLSSGGSRTRSIPRPWPRPRAGSKDFTTSSPSRTRIRRTARPRSRWSPSRSGKRARSS